MKQEQGTVLRCLPRNLLNKEILRKALAMTEQTTDIRDDEIDLIKVWGTLWAGKWIIFSFSLLVAVLAIFITMSMPNVYRSEALLAPAEESSGGGLSAQFGGLASLAGVNLGGAGADKVTIGIEVLKSRSFVTEFISRHDAFVPLLAAKSWDSQTGELILDPEIYDIKSHKWIQQKFNLDDKSSLNWAAYKKFGQILQVSQAKDTGLTTLSIRHYSPLLAKQWTALLIEDINGQMREREIEEKQKSIDYLRQQLEKTPVADMQQIFYQLIEKQMQTIMLANVRDQYLFKVIDPPIVPEEKDGPKRAMMVILSVVLAFIISVCFVLISHSIRRRDE